MRRFTKTEIGVLIATVMVLITANAYWRVKETGRRAKWVAEHDEAQMRDASGPSDASADAGPAQERD